MEKVPDRLPKVELTWPRFLSSEKKFKAEEERIIQYQLGCCQPLI
jgi:hypothetical protein